MTPGGKKKRMTFFFRPVLLWMALIFSLTLLCLPAGGCGIGKGQVECREDAVLMDTLVSIKAYGEGASAAVGEAMEMIRKMDSLFDRYREGSDVWRVNEMAGVGPVLVDDLTFQLVEEGLFYGELTGGALDITVGPLVDLWQIGREGNDGGIPTPNEIEKRLSTVGYWKVVLDGNKRTVFLPEKGMSLDLGAVAKGFASRRAAELLRERGVRSASIAVGGNVYALGARPDGKPWQVGVKDPWSKDRLVAKLKVTGRAVDTAGGYERFLEVGGLRFSHIIDPRCGQPASKVVSATVVADDPVRADALATAVCVLGGEDGLALLDSLPDAAGLIITGDGKVLLSSRFSALLEDVQLSGGR